MEGRGVRGGELFQEERKWQTEQERMKRGEK
jgi:hypothetical protein